MPVDIYTLIFEVKYANDLLVFVILHTSIISMCNGTPLFQPPGMRTPLYTVELLYSNSLK